MGLKPSYMRVLVRRALLQKRSQSRTLASCCHVPDATISHAHHEPDSTPRDYGFEIGSVRAKFGPGTLREVGHDAADLGIKRIAIFSDARVASNGFYHELVESVIAAGLEYAEYDECLVE